ncbi:hypothetical protein [Arthrobacter sp. MMS18-M83]|uniref:hypothetical protein n=1 Tax=Arthrobacter sp. MMS18-M83 TaxID=2996261 RepID=UPI00227AC8EA|nr:hypothetical protein [Arthrobacter sp. MMS18-M83]WAH96240.1 hypothetical protein OW521_17710 [Arthrobacter sp. MMS18-M83]
MAVIARTRPPWVARQLLPADLIDRGMRPATTGSMLALYAITGLPTSLAMS